MAARMTWVVDGVLLRSGCGRFHIEIGFRNGTAYRVLVDGRTGREHVCRSADSAKTLARSLAFGLAS